MADSFALYDELNNLNEDIFIDTITVCRTINNLSENHTEMIYLLMLHYFFITNKSLPKSPPYGCSTFGGGRGIKATWSNIPAKLQKIIVRYLNKFRE